MAFIPVANTAAVEVRAKLDGQEVENTLYFLCLTTLDETLLADLVSAVLAFWTARMIPTLPSSYELLEVYAYDMTTATGIKDTATPPAPVTGTRSGNPLPNNCSLFVQFESGRRGRGNYGGNFHCGLTESDVTGNEANNTIVGLITAAYTEMVGEDSLSTGWRWVIASRYYNKLPRSVGVTIPVKDALITDRTIDSQRRRLPGRGR